MSRTTHTWRAHALALVAGFAIVACQSAPPATSSPAATTGAASPEATAAPSPTAAAVDVVPLFAAAMEDLDSGLVSLEGSATVGPVKVALSGSSTFDGPDSMSTFTTTVGGSSSVVETVKVAGAAYTKAGDGPWLPAPTTQGKDLTKALKDGAAESLTDKGTETQDGLLVHKLEASSGSAFDPSVFLSSATGVSNVKGTTTFYCTDDGTPIGAAIELTWTQAAGTQTLDSSMAFEIKFRALGTAQTIRAPESVWKRFDVVKRGYSIAHPPDYDYTARRGFDYFIGPDDSFYFGSRSETQGFTLNIVAKSETGSIKSLLGTKTVSNEEITMGGLPGRLLSAKGSSADLGGKVVFYEAVIVKGKFFYFVAWVSAQGDEAADLALFRQVVATFQFLA